MVSKYLLFLMFLCFFPVIGESQVVISEESEITELMRQYRQTNASEQVVRAWRIQILTTNDRRTMEQGIKKFEILYPEINYSWEHNPPYYQVRIGAYELKEDLEAMLLQLKQDFPSALPVQAEMKKSKLLEY